MAVVSYSYGLTQAISSIKAGDQRLVEITNNIHVYLFNFGHNRLYLAIARSYYLRCVRSWDKVTVHLEKFLHNPRDNYSLLMDVLEHEIEKFSMHGYYCEQLRELTRLISQGPSFTH